MAHQATKKQEARRSYVFEGATIAVISLAIGVPDSTIRRWKRAAMAGGDDWDKQRAAYSVAGKGRDELVAESVYHFIVHFKEAVDRMSNSPEIPIGQKVEYMASLSDSYMKVVKASGRVSPKISELGVALDTLQRFGEFVARHNPVASEAFLTAVDAFGAELAEVYK